MAATLDDKTKRSVIQHGCHTIVFWISRDWLQTLLGPGTRYRHIQQVTENQGFYQIKKFVYQNTPEKKHIHLD